MPGLVTVEQKLIRDGTVSIKELVFINLSIHFSLLIKQRNLNPARTDTVNAALSFIVERYALEDKAEEINAFTATDINIRLFTNLIPYAV